MRNELWEPLVTIAGGVIAVAIIAVLVSRNAQTPQVFGAAGSAFSNVLSAATGPVTGAVAAPVNTFSSNSLSLPALSLGGRLGGTLLA
jgi:hypothetical protein